MRKPSQAVKTQAEQAIPAAEQASFARRVYAVVAQIPCGKAVSYGQIAWMIGAPRAARQVGWAMRHCPNELPWQRVVKADGSIAGGGFAPLRRAMLEAEGVPFDAQGRVMLTACRWNAPTEDAARTEPPKPSNA